LTPANPHKKFEILKKFLNKMNYLQNAENGMAFWILVILVFRELGFVRNSGVFWKGVNL
jgi:hypothetical protein